MPKLQKNKVIKHAISQFKSAIEHPEKYLSLQNQKADDIKLILKNLYDVSSSYGQEERNTTKKNLTLSHLIIDGMEEEQIWQQIELKNVSLVNENIKMISSLLSYQENKFSLNLNSVNSKNSDEEDENDDSFDEELMENGKINEYLIGADNDNEDDDEDMQEEEEEEDDEDDNVDGEEDEQSSKFKSIVDDEFFNLHEMHKFLDAEDKKEMTKDNIKPDSEDEEDDIDMFNEMEESDDEDAEGVNVKFKDFFESKNLPRTRDDNYIKKRDRKNKQRKMMRDEDLGEDEDIDMERNEEVENAVEQEVESELPHAGDSESDDNEDEPQSAYDIREKKLKTRISKMEEKALREKSWQLKGEVQAQNRPINSLLEEALDFDSNVRPAPVITEETTMKLEDIIKQRIKDKAFDDVELKTRSTETPQEYRKKLILNQEKSKESLVKIYENEFVQQANALKPNENNTIKEVPKEHQEIKNLMKSLFSKLDALSNFHYTPNQARPEVKIITNTPAISLEEVTPNVVSTSNLLAPEEVRGKRKGGDTLGKDERNRTDKNREVRKKKLKLKYTAKDAEKISRMSTKAEEREKLAKKVVNQRNTNLISEDSTQKIKSSKAFFTHLQENNKGKSKNSKLSKKSIGNEKSAALLKL